MEQSKKPPRSYKELKQKQKAKISDYMYLETQNFFQTNGRMPDTDEDCETVAQRYSITSPAYVSPPRKSTPSISENALILSSV